MLSRPNTALSQIHMQIMWSRLIAVVEEQAQTLVRTGIPPGIPGFRAVRRAAGITSDTAGRPQAMATAHRMGARQTPHRLPRGFPIIVLPPINQHRPSGRRTEQQMPAATCRAGRL